MPSSNRLWVLNTSVTWSFLNACCILATWEYCLPPLVHTFSFVFERHFTSGVILVLVPVRVRSGLMVWLSRKNSQVDSTSTYSTSTYSTKTDTSVRRSSVISLTFGNTVIEHRGIIYSRMQDIRKAPHTGTTLNKHCPHVHNLEQQGLIETRILHKQN